MFTISPASTTDSNALVFQIVTEPRHHGRAIDWDSNCSSRHFCLVLLHTSVAHFAGHDAAQPHDEDSKPPHRATACGTAARRFSGRTPFGRSHSRSGCRTEATPSSPW